jgi:hypothetical protein
MLPTERLDYSAIAERDPLALPDGAPLAVNCIECRRSPHPRP